MSLIQKAIDTLESSWFERLKDEFDYDYMKRIVSILEVQEVDAIGVYPPNGQYFKALNLCSFDNTKVVIVAQDPYVLENQATGLAFSVPTTTLIPPSLKNIYNELKEDIGILRETGDLSDWAEQGVLLLNSSLSVRPQKIGSHTNIGWEILTDRIISLLNFKKEHIVFILWGAHARSKKELIDHSAHLVLESSHPSPLSFQIVSGNIPAFKGSHPFSKTNTYLEANGIKPINWVGDHDLITKVKNLAIQFSKDKPEYSTPEGSYNKCYRACIDFMKVCPDTKLVNLEFCKSDFPNRTTLYDKNTPFPANTHNQLNDDTGAQHFVCYINDLYIDFTRKQFDSKSDYPHFSSLRDIRKEWAKISFLTQSFIDTLSTVIE